MAAVLEFLKIHNVQIIGAAVGIILFAVVFTLVKNGRMQERYSIIWFFIALFLLIISVFKQILEYFARLVGVIYAPNALFAVMLVCTYILLINQSVSLSTVKKQNKTLVQELALLREKVESAAQKDKDTDADKKEGNTDA